MEGMHRPRRLEFQVSRQARERYQLDESLFSLRGHVILANVQAARQLAHRMNQRRDVARFPERAVRAGELNAMGLIDEILHYVVGLYREQRRPEVLRQALDWLEARLGRQAVDVTLRRFAEEFPPLAVYRGEVGLETYLGGETEGVPNREVLLEELLLVWVANANPALEPFRELFDDRPLQRESVYVALVEALRAFFATQPTFGPDAEPLTEMLRRPARAVPHSLAGQLEYILKRWGYLLGAYLYRLLGSLDLIREEQKAIFLGPGPAQVYDYRWLELEAERFSPDRDWMPRLVLIAKNTYVWLSQLSRQYGRTITRVDEIPDEELDTLARRGINGLWLIGLWERSPASQRIKQMMGNPEAVASAYALFDYQIARDLGGPEALHRLRERAWRRGIRLASDMVPNHMGIDSRWVIEHPEWFIHLDYSPFPSYTFNGPDLSWEPRVGIFLEDHYYTRSDAAVVFKHVDRATGRERYIYHGNDGTSMPWNDTAQLNFLLPEVREAVIQSILQVARQFPVIRFDAAMTLTKKHYQRLWFPEPGSGGDIPSRAEHGMSRAEFDALMPQEFWREVVDRVAQEAPDTLLLAEAFWLLEGYFVRTLGMHRVYNSAFMNMLRDEMNAEYRQLIKHTLEFDPEILKRYVNFMNNPDERTAVDQFGKGDKYFGICTMMVTLPGLPMFGHGQIEGFGEKYGMEFRRAYWDEQPDAPLVERHEREIFPLLHRRWLFAEAKDFLLYDFVTPEGGVNEDVFAYSNRAGEERALVVYHNRFAEARGWIRLSAAYLSKGPEEERRLVRKSLGEGLGLRGEDDLFCVFRDQASGLEYIRPGKELCERGLYVELGAYQRHVFLDFREVRDDERRHLSRLAATLNGRGVPSVDEALRAMVLEPVQAPFRALVNASLARRIAAARVTAPEAEPDPALLDEVRARLLELLRGARELEGDSPVNEAVAEAARGELEGALRLPALGASLPARGFKPARAAIAYLESGLGDDPVTWGSFAALVFLRALGRAEGEQEAGEGARARASEWRLDSVLAEALRELGLDEASAWRRVELVTALVGRDDWLAGPDDAGDGTTGLRLADLLESWLGDGEVRRFLRINRFDDVLWFNHEAFQDWLWWAFAVAAARLSALAGRSARQRAAELVARHEAVVTLLRAEAESGYRVDRLLEAARRLAGGRPARIGSSAARR